MRKSNQLATSARLAWINRVCITQLLHAIDGSIKMRVHSEHRNDGIMNVSSKKCVRSCFFKPMNPLFSSWEDLSLPLLPYPAFGAYLMQLVGHPRSASTQIRSQHPKACYMVASIAFLCIEGPWRSHLPFHRGGIVISISSPSSTPVY